MEYPNDEMRDYVVAFLNDALAADREAITELMFTRVKVNTQELVDHPTIQVGPLDDDPDGDCYVGSLGADQWAVRSAGGHLGVYLRGHRQGREDRPVRSFATRPHGRGPVSR